MKKIKDFNYFVDEEGNVYNKKNKKLKPFINPDGYRVYCLYNENGRFHKRGCRLVAEAFIPNPDNKPCVNHKNCVRNDDKAENLEWVTHLENNLHGILNNPEDHRGNATITGEDAHRICALIQDGLRLKDISDITGLPTTTVEHISSGTAWKAVATDYNFPEKRSRVSVTTAKWVKSQLDLGFSYEDILQKTSNKRLSKKIISLIDSKRIYKEIFHN